VNRDSGGTDNKKGREHWKNRVGCLSIKEKGGEIDGMLVGRKLCGLVDVVNW
jgi:hypothetical protein